MDALFRGLVAHAAVEAGWHIVTSALFSKQWYRVANLQPQIKNHVFVRRHYYRSQLWYVISTKSNDSHLRINASAYYLYRQFNGERTVDEIWKSGLETLEDDAPTQDELVSLLSELFDVTAVDFQKQSDLDQIFDNHRAKQSKSARAKRLNPLFMRFGLFDPDALVVRMLPHLRFLFSRTTCLLWLALCLVSLVLAWYQSGDLSKALQSDLTSPRNLIIMWFVFPIMKLLHELAHALAVRRWGGEVHEFGVAFLILIPVPYVDASQSSGFANKYRRMAVAGAGIAVESTLACLAFFLWLAIEPGLVRDVAFNVALTGTLSCLLFNGNPLLKFDAYYVLSDALEIPSLASRSGKYLLYLMQRYLFGIDARSPATADGERRWFFTYGLLALGYRLTLTFGICLFVAGEYFFIGVALALWSFSAQIVWPILKGLRFLLASERVAGHRFRANGVVTVALVALVSFAGFLKFPHVSEARGVVWPVDEAMIRAGTDCLVEEVLVENNALVSVGQEILRCDTTLLDSEVAQFRAELTAARAAAFSTRDRVERNARIDEANTAEKLLARAQQRLARTTVRSKSEGALHVPDSDNLTGRYFRQGELVGYLLSDSNTSIRSMLGQERIALLGDRLENVEVMSVADHQVVASRVVRRMPAATDQLVTPALGTNGGGDLPVSLDANEQTRLEQAAFELEIELPAELHGSAIGEAMWVKFDHGSESLAVQGYRQLQLLLLRRFNV